MLLAGPDRAAPRRLAVLEALNDAENLGSIARSAVALGVDGLLLDPRCADPLYRRSVRVSMGHALQVPFARLPSSLDASLDVLSARGFALLALSPAGSVALRDAQVPRRWALLVGAEGPQRRRMPGHINPLRPDPGSENAWFSGA